MHGKFSAPTHNLVCVDGSCPCGEGLVFAWTSFYCPRVEFGLDAKLGCPNNKFYPRTSILTTLFLDTSINNVYGPWYCDLKQKSFFGGQNSKSYNLQSRYSDPPLPSLQCRPKIDVEKNKTENTALRIAMLQHKPDEGHFATVLHNKIAPQQRAVICLPKKNIVEHYNKSRQM
jgi:hypothetical protein